MTNKNTRRGFTQKVVKNNSVNIPELVSGSSTQAVMQQKLKQQALKMPKQVRQYPYLTRGRGFTLIELLVVVLIIGILAAVAVPQYQKAVEKSRAVQALTLLKTMYMAAEGFYMGNGVWPNQLDDLDLEISWEGNTKWYRSATPEAISNQDWSLQLDKHDDRNEMMVGRISGPYQGGGFVMFQKYYSDDMPLRTPVCAEIKGYKAQGKYCEQIFQGEFFRETEGFLYYSLP